MTPISTARRNAQAEGQSPAAAAASAPGLPGWPRGLELRPLSLRLGLPALMECAAEMAGGGDDREDSMFSEELPSAFVDAYDALVDSAEWEALPALRRLHWLSSLLVRVQTAESTLRDVDTGSSEAVEHRHAVLVRALRALTSAVHATAAATIEAAPDVLLPPSEGAAASSIASATAGTGGASSEASGAGLFASIATPVPAVFRRLVAAGLAVLRERRPAAARAATTAALVTLERRMREQDAAMGAGPSGSDPQAMLAAMLAGGGPPGGASLGATAPAAAQEAARLVSGDRAFAETYAQAALAVPVVPGVTAPAMVERQFFLGRILAASPIQPSGLAEMGLPADPLRMTLPELQAAHARMRTAIESSTGMLADAVLALARGGQRAPVQRFLAGLVAINRERAKEHYSPAAACSDGFALNLCSLAYALAAPVAQPGRLARVDPAGLLALVPAVPAATETEALLAPPVAGGESAGEGGASATVSREEIATLVAASLEPPLGTPWVELRPSDTAAAAAGGGEDSLERFGFATVSFLMAAAATRVGLAPVVRRHRHELRLLQHLHGRMQSGDEGAGMQFRALFQMREAKEAYLGDSSGFMARGVQWAAAALVWATVVCSDGLAVASTAAAGDATDAPATAAGGSAAAGERLPALLSAIRIPLPEDTSILPLAAHLVPEWLVSDAVDILVTASETAPAAFDALPAEMPAALLRALTALLASPHALRSPHVRASMALLLLRAFLPPAASPEGPPQRRPGEPEPTGPLATQAALSHAHAAPAAPALIQGLMGLFGDVKATGHYEQVEHRFRIMGVLRWLWQVGGHYRESFLVAAREADAESGAVVADEGEAASAASSAPAFLRFADGIITHTSALVDDALRALATIREAEDAQADAAAWAALSDEARQERTAALEQDHRTARSSLLLANQTIALFAELTEAETCIRPFLHPVLTSRLAPMILNLIKQLGGRRCQELKVHDGAKRFHFRPRELMGHVVTVAVHLARSARFVTACAESGMLFGASEDDFRRAVTLVNRHSLVDGSTARGFEAFVDAALAESQAMEGDEEALGEIPDVFTCALGFDLLRDPVMLPLSKEVVGRAIIRGQLLTGAGADPFNRQPLAEADLISLPELGAAVERWAAARRAGQDEEAAAVQAEAEALVRRARGEDGGNE